MSVSVCMAAYNGEKYIARQLDSILSELGPDDEVIVVDDGSMDETLNVVRAMSDRRISVYANDRNRGEVHSFSRALALATKDYLFLSDQDDVWVPGRVAAMVSALHNSRAAVVTSNFTWMDAKERPIDVEFDGVSETGSRHHLRNIFDIFRGKTNYFGCGMAIRREFVPLIVPIPSWVESHDLWVALASNLAGSNVHLNAATLRKRRHGNNATSTVSTRSLMRKVLSRVIFARSLATLQLRRLAGRGS